MWKPELCVCLLFVDSLDGRKINIGLSSCLLAYWNLWAFSVFKKRGHLKLSWLKVWCEIKAGFHSPWWEDKEGVGRKIWELTRAQAWQLVQEKWVNKRVSKPGKWSESMRSWILFQRPIRLHLNERTPFPPTGIKKALWLSASVCYSLVTHHVTSFTVNSILLSRLKS